MHVNFSGIYTTNPADSQPELIPPLKIFTFARQLIKPMPRMTIHREGYKIILSTILILLAINAGLFVLLSDYPTVRTIVLIASIVFLIAVLQFFRSPKREIVQNHIHVLSPADGKVVAIEEVLEENLPVLLKSQQADLVIGTSKTLRTIARVASDWLGGDIDHIQLDRLTRMIPKLADMTELERAELPGVSKTRARQIVAGAIVAESVMKKLDIRELRICPWALREGIILKWLDWIRG